MPYEIERKFLLKDGSFKSHSTTQVRVTQGYLCSVPERTVRVRIKGDKGVLTIKGIGNESGASRFEWEQEIALEEAQSLLELCEPGIIDKTRYLVDFSGLVFEVDEFHGTNQGLVVAEVELESEDQSFESPGWLGQEITGDVRYYNSMLIKHPFTDWY
jgi:adenylate cyclase